MTRRELLAAAPAAALMMSGAARAEDLSVTHGEFSSAGSRIHYIEVGQGEPVALMHGFTGNAQTWVTAGVCAALARRFRVVALDARGHGSSDKPHDPEAYGADAALDVIRLMDHLGLSKFHLVGYSMGAHTAAYLATKVPDRFLTCTLAAAAGRFHWTAENQFNAEREADELAAGSMRPMLRRLWPSDAPLSEKMIRQISAEVLRLNDAKALSACMRAVYKMAVTLEQLRAVQVPILGLVGTADPALKDFRTLQAANVPLELVAIEGATHASAMSSPRFIEALQGFLAAHPARAA
jgi:pimeloyl-ACP methyl ester carboxylesterase